MASPWHIDSWRSKPIKQQPKYPDAAKLRATTEHVSRLPPLVTHEEVDRLRAGLAEVAEGKRFLLQGGDCAERFLDCAAEPIEKKLRILLQMSLVLTWGARIPTLRIARMAGQFAKPRSKDTEIIEGREYAAFRGDNVNSFDTSAREADPERMVAGYFHSAATLNYARSLLSGGLADLHQASHWDLGFVQDSSHRRQYKEMADRILSSLDFMRVCGVGNEAALKTADVYMSHEGLQLDYEAALTRPVPVPSVLMHLGAGGAGPAERSGSHGSAGEAVLVPRHIPSDPDLAAQTPGTPVAPPAAHLLVRATSSRGVIGSGEGQAPPVPHSPVLFGVHKAGGLDPRGPAPFSPAPFSLLGSDPHRRGAMFTYYNLGTHFLWIGDRTRQLDHAHVEYFRGIANPVGIKVGPSSSPSELVALLRILWPQPRKQRGKIVLITRFGATAVRAKLPALIKAVQDANFEAPVVWTCDPMHGNTRTTSSGFKTRDFDDILTELRDTFEVHREMGSRLGGCHFELTGENVTECTGGPEHLMEGDLPRRYTTYCDPRLNYAQGMELAFLIAQYLADIREEELARESGVPTEAFIGSDVDVFGGRTAGFAAGVAPLPVAAGAPGAPAGGSSEQEPNGATCPEGSDTDTDGGGSIGSLSGPNSHRGPRRARFAAGRGADGGKSGAKAPS